MMLFSTSDRNHRASFARAVDRGIAPDGGLYLPEHYPWFSPEFFAHTRRRSFAETAFDVARRFLSDEIPERVLGDIAADAFSFPVPLHRLDDRLSVLELFHGPTLAFKDIGARFMARVMRWLHRDDDRDIVVLVATSGDTGGAVASGFAGVAGVRVVLCYPGGRVSPLQELQLTTGGETTTTLRVEGTFDDCQRLVKQAFEDPELSRGRTLTSANSINIARLLPQTFYFVSTWGEVYQERRRTVFVIPSGNFGNLTAGLMARAMGVGAAEMVAAMNVNDVFAEYLQRGTYTPRMAIRTLSNAMDVGDPSNLARVRALFADDLTAMRRVISTRSFTDQETRDAVREAFQQYGYVFDPHGAVAYRAARAYLSGRGDDSQAVILATAHPAKFPEALEEDQRVAAGFPEALRDLERRPQRQKPINASYDELREILRAL
jgi:threonine synthase